MLADREDFYYHRVEQDLPQNLFFALEGWLDDADLVQVFENELGLFLSDQHYVMPLPYRSAGEFRRSQRRYEELCRTAGFRVDLSAEWNLDGSVGQELAAGNPAVAAQLLAAEDRLVSRYDWWDGPGHRSGLAVIALKPPASDSREGRSP